jgi:RNA polymerase sigma factor (sigma-70 family)
VDDVVQDVCIRLWQKSRLVREARTPAAYITEIVKEVVRIHRWRTQRREDALAAHGDQVSRAGAPTPEQHTFARQCCAIVDGFLDQIDKQALPLFIEHEVDGDSVAEIAARHGLKEGRVKKLLGTARRALEAAKVRWEAGDLRHGGGRLLRGVMVPFCFADLRGWLRSPPRIAVRVALASTVILLANVLCPSDLYYPEARSAFQRVAHLAFPRFALSSSVGSSVSPARAAGPAPELAEHGVKAPAGPPSSSQSNARVHDASELEEKLLGGARAALFLGTPEGMVRARQLLEEHRARVPEGRLAPEREALLSWLRRAQPTARMSAAELARAVPGYGLP